MNVNIHYTIHEIADITGGILIQELPGEVMVDYLSLDSRRILSPKETIFFSINSNNKSGDISETLLKFPSASIVINALFSIAFPVYVSTLLQGNHFFEWVTPLQYWQLPWLFAVHVCAPRN